MSPSTPYLVIAVAVLLLIFLTFFIWKVFVKKKMPESNMSFLGALAIPLIVGGIAFGDNKIVGYGLIGAGVLFAVIDILRRVKKR